MQEIMTDRTRTADDQSLRRRDILKASGVAAGLGVAGTVGVGSGSPNTHTLLTQNAWLLDEAYAGLVPNQPEAADLDGVPRDNSVKPIEKPALDERARELGARLSYSDFDIVGLQEVFDEEQRKQIRSPIQREFDDAVGPKERPENASVSSGLYTLAIDHSILESERMAFENRGNTVRDADARAEKGVLFTRVALEDGAIDLFTTHLLAGGGFPGEEVDPSPVRERTSEEEFRRKQLEEFEAFVDQVKADHDPDGEIPIVCAGDFNIAPGDSEAPALEAFQRNLGLVDAWEENHPEKQGGTDTDAITDACRFDPFDSPPSYCAGGEAEDADRIDYVLVEDRSDITVKSIRRRVFWRELASPDQFFVDENEEVPNYLADHIGLEVEFSVNPS